MIVVCGLTITLNKITLKDNYPLPLIEDLLDRLRGKKYFSILDLKSGFYHVRVNEDAVKYTSFVTCFGQFEWLRMPFGLKNAPSVFQRYINNIFKDLISSDKLFAYMDDLLIATDTVEEHLTILKTVMNVINELELKIDKCKFMYEEIVYLGHTIKESGFQPNPENLKAAFPIPKNTKEVLSFIGLCSYFRKKRHKTPSIYNIGDYVMIKHVNTISGINHKLLPKYRGPYEIRKILENDRYLIKDISGMQLSRLPYTGVCAAANMKLYQAIGN